jgi:C_GCAxxG_C_C family probable redox protein
MTRDPEEVAARGRELFDGSLYCAESVLQVVAEQQGISSPLIPRIATGFCSGLARTGGPCGAVTGAVMAMGLLSGRDGGTEEVLPCYEAVQRFLDRFQERFGAISCPGLIGVDLGTPEGRAAFEQQGLHDRCRGFVEGAASMVIEVALTG